MKKKLLAIAALTVVCALSFGQQAGPQGGGFGPPQGPGGGMRGGPGMGPGGGMQGPQLLMNASVQKELNLTEDQKEQIQALAPAGRGPGGPPQGGQRGGEGRQGGGPPQGGRGAGGPGDQGEMEKKIKAILSSAQYKRYQEISLQQQGASAISRPEVAEKLGITEAQHEQIREIMESNRQNMRPPQGGQGERPDPEQMRAEMEKNREALNRKIVAVLSNSQKTAWQSMLGKAFKIVNPQGGPGFGGPGGPGGPGRGPGGGF